MTSAELMKALKKRGWIEVSRKGSYITFKHAKHNNIITVSHHKGKDIPTGLLNRLLKEAGLK